MWTEGCWWSSTLCTSLAQHSEVHAMLGTGEHTAEPRLLSHDNTCGRVFAVTVWTLNNRNYTIKCDYFMIWKQYVDLVLRLYGL